MAAIHRRVSRKGTAVDQLLGTQVRITTGMITVLDGERYANQSKINSI
jgi:hypothetical protein